MPDARRQYAPSPEISRRLARLVRLRAMGAPRWVVRHDQVLLLMAAPRHATLSIMERRERQGALVESHVWPIMDLED